MACARLLFSIAPLHARACLSSPRFHHYFFTGLACLTLITSFTDAQAQPIPEAEKLSVAASKKAPLIGSASLLTPSEERTIALYQKASPAVVNISNTSYALTLNLEVMPQKGMGSGILLTEDGYILTNAHVVKGASQIEVSLLDAPYSYTARVVGGDASYDIALLKIEAKPGQRFPTIPLGSSADLKVGQSVLAIGNPFGLKSTLTTGIISSLGRRLEAQNGRVMENIIQTDAAINPGNSGGALLDSSGRLIGINTAIFSPSGTSSGIGFAIPIDRALIIANDLIQHGRIIRPYMGVAVGLQINPRVASILQLPVTEGVMLAEVLPGSPAAKAGLKGSTQILNTRQGTRVPIGGDIVIKVDEKPIATIDSFLNYIEAQRPGDVVKLTVIRGKERVVLPLTLGEIPPKGSL